MNKSEIDLYTLETATAKVTAGFRCEPELKKQLIEEADSSGICLSEYLEAIVNNRDVIGKERIEWERETAAYQEKINRLEEELQKLISHTGGMSRQSNSDDKRLQYLFENLKGKSDTVEDPYHPNFPITYNTAEDVLRALIYSCALKK